MIKTYLYRVWQWLYKGVPILQVPANLCVTNSAQRLANHKIIITGGNRGIGYMIAKRFVSEGANVVLVGRDLESLKKVASELNCYYIQYDLFNINHFEDLIDVASQKMGGVTGLINNAGVCNIDNGFLNVTEHSYDEQFALNVKVHFFLTQQFVRYVTEHKVKSSGVVFITSERGLYPDDAPYGMTKAAIGNIIAGIARKFAIQGVHINGIAPGVTANVSKNPEKYDDLYLKNSIAKRFVLPEELAEVAVFLMSDASKCISGEIIPCNIANHYK